MAETPSDTVFALASMLLLAVVVMLALDLEREIHRMVRSFPGFRDRWKWRRRIIIAVCIAAGLLVFWRWL